MAKNLTSTHPPIGRIVLKGKEYKILELTVYPRVWDTDQKQAVLLEDEDGTVCEMFIYFDPSRLGGY